MSKSASFPIENFEEKQICSWEDIMCVFNKHNNSKKTWIYRGQADPAYYLTTNLERSFVKYYGNCTDTDLKNEFKDYNKLIAEYNNKENNKKIIKQYYQLKYLLKKKTDIYLIEQKTIREFKRKASNYLNKIPDDSAHIEWLSLMQHYGAPTRLLDFTYSFFVALYIAIEDAEKECAVYAIDNSLFIESLRKKYGDHCKIFEESSKNNEKKIKDILNKNYKKSNLITFNISPFNCNERITIQQGTFLCQKNINQPFIDNLRGNIKKCEEKNKIIKYIIKADNNLRQKIIDNLHRQNISRMTIYPGLEGFASSLKIRLTKI